MQFRHGDRVTCTINGKEVTDARISINKKEKGGYKRFLCQNVDDGGYSKYCNEMFGYTKTRVLHEYFTNGEVSNLRLAEKSWETLKEGDLIFDKDGDEAKVLGVVGKIVFRSCRKAKSNNWDTIVCGYNHIEELKRAGWTLTNPKEEPSDEEKAIKLLTERGRLKDGKVIV